MMWPALGKRGIEKEKAFVFHLGALATRLAPCSFTRSGRWECGEPQTGSSICGMRADQLEIGETGAQLNAGSPTRILPGIAGGFPDVAGAVRSHGVARATAGVSCVPSMGSRLPSNQCLLSSRVAKGVWFGSKAVANERSRGNRRPAELKASVAAACKTGAAGKSAPPGRGAAAPPQAHAVLIRPRGRCTGGGRLYRVCPPAFRWPRPNSMQLFWVVDPAGTCVRSASRSWA